MDYITTIDINVQDVFDHLPRATQEAFLKENATMLDRNDIWDLMNHDEQEAVVDEVAEEFGYVKIGNLPI